MLVLNNEIRSQKDEIYFDRKKEIQCYKFIVLKGNQRIL